MLDAKNHLRQLLPISDHHPLKWRKNQWQLILFAINSLWTIILQVFVLFDALSIGLAFCMFADLKMLGVITTSRRVSVNVLLWSLPVVITTSRRVSVNVLLWSLPVVITTSRRVSANVQLWSLPVVITTSRRVSVNLLLYLKYLFLFLCRILDYVLGMFISSFSAFSMYYYLLTYIVAHIKQLKLFSFAS